MRGEGREEREGRKGGGVGPLSKQREVVRREGQRRVTGALIGKKRWMVDALMGGRHGKPGCWIIASSPTL